MRTLTLVFAAALLASSSASLRAQDAKEGKEKETKPALAALAEAAEVRLDKAIALALKARAGIAVGVELESAVVKGEPRPVFEVMVCGKDDTVYEVFVDGVDGSIVSKEPCKDEEDIGEVKALVHDIEGAASLRDIVAESRALLRGTCVQAALVAKDKQALVVLLNRGHRIAARFGLKDGQLTGVAWLDAKKAKKAGDDDDDDDEEEEGEEHEGGEHAATNGKAGKHEEHEEHEGRKHEESGEAGERAKKGSGEKPKQGAKQNERQF